MQDVKALGLRTKCFVNSLAYDLFYQPQIKTPLEKKILSFKKCLILIIFSFKHLLSSLKIISHI